MQRPVLDREVREIQQFCSTRCSVSFPLFERVTQAVERALG